MKSNISYPLIIVFILCVHGRLLSQTFEANDYSRQVNLPNNGGTVNINNYLTKSDEYKALTKQLEDLDKDIQDKTGDCAALEALKSERVDKCRQSLNALSEKRNALANNIQQFKEDVIRLAETFKNATDKSELFLKAEELFEQGKFRETSFLLNSKELTAMGDDGIEKAKIAGQLFLIKAQNKALDYTDPLRIDSTAFCYRQSLRYNDAAQTLYNFAVFFIKNNLYDSAFLYFPKIIVHPKAEDWQIGLTYGRLGELHRITGDLNKALGYYEKMRKLFEELHEAYQQNVEFKNGLASSYEKLGQAHKDLDNLPKALTFFEEFSSLMKELHKDYQQNVEFKNGLAISYEKLGETNTALGNLDTALTFFEDRSRLGEELHKDYPQNVAFKNGLASSYEKLGQAHNALGNLPKALAFFEKFSSLMKELHKDYPQNVAFKNGLAISYEKLGQANIDLGNLPKALTFFEDETKLFEELHEAYPQNLEFKKGLAISYLMLGKYFRDQKHDTAQARHHIWQGLALYEALVRDFPDFVGFNKNLSWARKALADLDK